MDPNSTLALNAPNQSLLQQAYTPTFGNIAFEIQPSMTGEVSNTFGTVPYFSLEALVYAQQVGAQVSPNVILPGQNQGQQNVQGAYTITDGIGNTRMVMGYEQDGF